MAAPCYVLATEAAQRSAGGFIVILTLASGQRFAVKGASVNDEDGILECDTTDGRELLIDIGAIEAVEEKYASE